MHRLLELPLLEPASAGDRLRLLAHGLKERTLSDIVEVTVFVQGLDGRGEEATAGGKLVVRGGRMVIPPSFLDGAEPR